MGKVVKTATFKDEKYVVGVPHVEHNALAQAVDFDPFAAYTSNGHPAEAVDIVADAPEVLPQPSVDWERVRADAEAIVDRAAADAKAILADVEEHAHELLDAAREEARAIAERAHAEAHAQGLAQGQADGKAEFSPLVAQMRDVLAATLHERRDAIMAAEPELVRLSMGIAERILHSEIANNREVVVGNVRHALTRLSSREVVTLRLNPADMEVIRRYRDDIVAASDVEHLRVVEDARVDRGGVMIETEAGTIDAKIATQLREAQRAILTDDDFAIGPSYLDEEMLHETPQAS